MGFLLFLILLVLAPVVAIIGGLILLCFYVFPYIIGAVIFLASVAIMCLQWLIKKCVLLIKTIYNFFVELIQDWKDDRE